MYYYVTGDVTLVYDSRGYDDAIVIIFVKQLFSSHGY